MKVYIGLFIAMIMLVGCGDEDNITVAYNAKNLQGVVTGWAMGAQSVTLIEDVNGLEGLLFKSFTIQQGKTLVIAKNKTITVEGTILKAGSYTGSYGSATLTQSGNLLVNYGGVLFDADITIGKDKKIRIRKDAALCVGKPDGDNLLLQPDEDVQKDGATFTADGNAVKIIGGRQGTYTLIPEGGTISNELND